MNIMSVKFVFGNICKIQCAVQYVPNNVCREDSTFKVTFTVDLYASISC